MSEMLELAEKIISGEWSMPYGRLGHYSAEAWLEAAEWAIKNDDFSDLQQMDEYEATFDEFLSWVNRNPRERDDVSYDEWRERYL